MDSHFHGNDKGRGTMHRAPGKYINLRERQWSEGVKVR